MGSDLGLTLTKFFHARIESQLPVFAIIKNFIRICIVAMLMTP